MDFNAARGAARPPSHAMHAHACPASPASVWSQLGASAEFDVTLEMLTDDIFKKRRIHKDDKIHDKPKVGLVNGLWAHTLSTW